MTIRDHNLEKLHRQGLDLLVSIDNRDNPKKAWNSDRATLLAWVMEVLGPLSELLGENKQLRGQRDSLIEIGAALARMKQEAG